MKERPQAGLHGRSLADLVRHPDVHEEHVAILIARDAHATLRPQDVLAELDALANDFEADGFLTLDAREQATLLIHHLALRHGFTGNKQHYYDPENSYLDSVLKRKLGIPISLAVVYLAVARRLGIEAEPVGFPGHFLVRIGAEPDLLEGAAGDPSEGVFVDPFEGRTLNRADLAALLVRALGPGSELSHEHMEAVSPLQLAQRMLLNLKRVYETQHDYARTLLVCDRLVDLGASPELRRDRGLCALKLGAHKVAAADLAHYLLKRPRASDAKDVRNQLARARKSEAPLN